MPTLPVPNGLAADAAGNLYISQAYTRRIVKVPAGGGLPIPLASGLSIANGRLAVDPAGNVFVFASTDVQLGAAIFKIPAQGGSPVSVQSRFTHVIDMLADGQSNIYVTDCPSSCTLWKLPSDGSGTPISLPIAASRSSGFTAVDEAGDVYV